MMQDEVREGHYRDKYGRWQGERRSGVDRREARGDYAAEQERRRMFRRKADRELLEKDHQAQIDEALDDFAAEHDGRL